MNTRRIILLAMLVAAGPALAQAPASPQAPLQGHGQWKDASQWQRENQQRRMERLSVLLDLTPAQRRQVQAIFADEHARMRTAMQQVQQAMRQARATHQAVRKDAEQRLAAVLSPAQMKKLRVLMPEHPHERFMMRERGMGSMGPLPPPGPDAGPGPQ